MEARVTTICSEPLGPTHIPVPILRVSRTFPSVPCKLYLISHYPVNDISASIKCPYAHDTVLSSEHQNVFLIFDKRNRTWYRPRQLHRKHAFNGAAHLPNLYYRISSAHEQSGVIRTNRFGCHTHDFFLHTSLYTHLVKDVRSSIPWLFSPEHRIAKGSAIAKDLVVFVLAMQPKYTSDLTKSDMILRGRLYFSARGEVPEPNTVGSFLKSVFSMRYTD